MKLASFEQTLKNEEFEVMVLSPGCKTEIKGLFTNSRIDRDSLPEGWHAYDIRGLNSPGSLENYVLVNHYGTFCTKTPPEKMYKPGRNWRGFSGRGGWTFSDIPAEELIG